MLLDVKNLAVNYARNSKPTIEGVSFELDEGEILAIVGESGSGKTTVIRAIFEYIQTHSDLDKKAAYDMAVGKLELMNLPNPENILSSYTFELSGGMRQRVGIAIAITFQPKLLLATRQPLRLMSPFKTQSSNYSSSSSAKRFCCLSLSSR